MSRINFDSIPYIPGTPPKDPKPLSRFLPPVPDGVISTWLTEHIAPGAWVLDPFGASPRLAIEAAHAGYRILVTSNNPIARFLLEMAAVPPKSDDLKSTLAELAASYKGEERIEPHIRSLYNTHCARCGQIVSADAFYWEHGNPSPYMRIYTCPFCDDSGEHPCTPYDTEQANQFSSSGIHKARALERVVATNDQDRIHVEQALSVYLPRALYGLITIINKIEGLDISPTGKKYLSALLLYAFDQASAMWNVSNPRERRRQLAIPRHYRENNIWEALEQGVNLWSASGSQETNPPIAATIWPEMPPTSGGICIFEGKLISIADSLPNLEIKSVCTAIPRPNQAFWTLSALWAGWLWGREAVGSFKSVLHRQRYDWGWHTTALSSVFKQLANILTPSTSILGVLGEAEPGFIAAALVAARTAGCGLNSIALRTDENQAQIIWKSEKNPISTNFSESLSEVGILSAKEYLEVRGEPVNYLPTIVAAVQGITQAWSSGSEKTDSTEKSEIVSASKTGEVNELGELTPAQIYSTIYNTAREALSYRFGFLRYHLQDLSNIENSSKNQIIQTTLFSLDSGNYSDENNETINSELSSSESELASEKERPTRSSDVTESTFLWLRETENVNHSSISDRYELALVNFLLNHPNCSSNEINKTMCEQFPGLYTPDSEFISVCLESYGEPDLINGKYWHVRPEDNLDTRQMDLENSNHYIHQIGERLGFMCEDHSHDRLKTTITWVDQKVGLDYRFFSTISAAISEIVIFGEKPPMKAFIVLPGSRANLIVYKLRRDPRLSKEFNPSQGNWRFLKFRHLRSLVENPLLNRENLDLLLELDPLTYTTPQLRLI
jgi:hypothetical protein